MNDFGNEVRRFLKLHNLRQWKLARELGVDPAYLSKVLRGWFPVKREMQARIVAAMKNLLESKRE